MTFLMIVIGVLGGIGILFCLFMAISKAILNKEERENERIATTGKFASDADAYSYFQTITGVIFEKFYAAFEKYQPFRDKIAKVRDSLGDTEKTLTELHDKDLDELNEIYEKYNKYQVANAELLNSERYLTLKENCIRKNLPNIASYCAKMEEICQLNIKAYPYAIQFEEWDDVRNLKAREKWSLPEQKELFDKLYAVRNNEQYLAIQKKLDKWKPYSKGSLLIFDNNAKSYEIGRKDNEVALKDQKSFEIKTLSVNDIIFVQVVETSNPSYSVSKPSKMGIAMTEMVWGTAAATASAMQKNQPVSTSRKAEIYFRYDLNIGPLHTTTDSADKLLAMFPEKIK